MARQKSPDSGTVFGGYTSVMRSVITDLKDHAIAAVPCGVSYQDLWDAMYPAEAQPVLKEWVPKMGNAGVGWIIVSHPNYDVRVTARELVHNGVTRPPLISHNMWAGERKEEVLNAITNVGTEKRMVAEQWGKVFRTFDHLNGNARTMNKMFSLWPAIKQLCEVAELYPQIAQMGAYKHYQPPPMTAAQYDDLRQSVAIVGVAMIAHAHAGDTPRHPVVVSPAY